MQKQSEVMKQITKFPTKVITAKKGNYLIEKEELNKFRGLYINNCHNGHSFLSKQKKKKVVLLEYCIFFLHTSSLLLKNLLLHIK